MPVEVGSGFQVSVFISVQTKFFNGATRYITQTLSFINVLNENSGLFLIQFYPVGNSRRRHCLTYHNRADISLPFLFHQTSNIIKYIYQINPP